MAAQMFCTGCGLFRLRITGSLLMDARSERVHRAAEGEELTAIPTYSPVSSLDQTNGRLLRFRSAMTVDW